MESNSLNAIFLPLASFIIMLGMGLSLTLDDFKRILVEPKPVILGLFAQLVILPTTGFLLAKFFSLSPELAIGLMIITACPGGVTSNILTYFAEGNVALSITLTAISSLVTILTIPLAINISMQTFMGGEIALRLPFLNTVIQIAMVTLMPVVLGIVTHRYRPRLAAKIEKGVKYFSLGFLAVVIISILIRERANLSTFFLQAGWVTLMLNVVAMGLGYGISTLAQLHRRSIRAITIEVGFQNIPLALVIANGPTLLNNSSMAIPAVTYGLLMFVTSGAFIALVKRYS
ncbi:MAG: bile acid:sodium symporter family protein [Cyanobacteria bacterium P01_B01_bin.77]